MGCRSGTSARRGWRTRGACPRRGSSPDLAVVAHQLLEVGAVPGGDVALERAHVQRGPAPLRAMAVEAADPLRHRPAFLGARRRRAARSPTPPSRTRPGRVELALAHEPAPGRHGGWWRRAGAPSSGSSRTRRVRPSWIHSSRISDSSRAYMWMSPSVKEGTSRQAVPRVRHAVGAAGAVAGEAAAPRGHVEPALHRPDVARSPAVEDVESAERRQEEDGQRALHARAGARRPRTTLSTSCSPSALASSASTLPAAAPPPPPPASRTRSAARCACGGSSPARGAAGAARRPWSLGDSRRSAITIA